VHGAYTIVATDAARHAMNGAFLYDLIVRGSFSAPIEFARTYYAHYPALSMPYHPPAFPLIEAVFFFVFGVNAFAARLSVALAVAVCSFFLFRLAVTTHRSAMVAACSAITFLCLPESMAVGSDVMLEFPVLAFTLLAIRCLQPAETGYSMRRASAFALLAAAAVWTKQQAVFLGAVPFLYFALLGRWQLLRKPPIWVSTAIFGALVAVLAALSLPVHGAGVNQVLPKSTTVHGSVWSRNVPYYVQHYSEAAGVAGVILLGAFAVAVVTGLCRRKQAALYIAWAVPAIAVLFLIRPFSTRYLHIVFPALFVLGYSGLMSIVERVTGSRRWALAAAAALMASAVFWKFPYPTQFVNGPDQAARLLAGTGAQRILYCGKTDGNFIFQYRSIREGLDTVVIAGDKLPAVIFRPEEFHRFAHEYGVQYVVLEEFPGVARKPAWLPLISSPPPSLVFERAIPVSSSMVQWTGALRLYRFTDPSPNPKADLSLRMNMIGRTMNFHLGQ
jgi:hypothetical protein